MSENSTISFEASNITYHIPDVLEIDPALIYDDKNEVLRVSLGTAQEQYQEQYQKLFRAIDRRIRKRPFLDGISFFTGGKELYFDIAYVTRTNTRYGIFYDIEATKEESIFRERKNNATDAKSKKV